MPQQYTPGLYWMERPVVGVAEPEGKSAYVYIEGDITLRANGETNEELEHVEKRTVFLYVTPGALPFTMQKLEALGFNGDFNLPELSKVEADGGVWVQADEETYQGKARIKWNLPGGTMEHKAASPNKIRELNAIYKANKKTAGKPASPPPPPKPVPDPDAAPEPINPKNTPF